MKYRYLYQTKENENCEGWISAPNRMEAYAALRRQGIRPYRVIGDDPPFWRRHLARLVAAVAVLAAVLAGVFAWQSVRSARAPLPRGQLFGDRTRIFDGVRGNWRTVFSRPLERYLSAYAQPGTEARVPLLTSEEMQGLSEAARQAVDVRPLAGDPPEVRQLRRIVAGMRADFAAHLARGGTAADYLAFLEVRQREERDLRARAASSVAATPPVYRYRAWRAANAQLDARGIETLEVPDGLSLEEEQP